MAGIFFFIAGIILIFKKEMHITKKRTLAGRPAKILGILYILPYLIGVLVATLAKSGIVIPDFVIWMMMALAPIAIIATLYLVLFYKPKTSRQPPLLSTGSRRAPPPAHHQLSRQNI